MTTTWKDALIPADRALPGRAQTIATAETHFVFDRPLKADTPDGYDSLIVGMGCFWGVERIFWQMPGVWLTAAGYAGGFTPNPTYEEVCSGETGHAEVVRIVFDPAQINPDTLFKAFWENHDPTQGMRQGNDRGTQYRSAIYASSGGQLAAAKSSAEQYQKALSANGRGQISTEIAMAGEFYFAEDYHQQYLAKNPEGYCGIGGTGIVCPIGTGVAGQG